MPCLKVFFFLLPKSGKPGILSSPSACITRKNTCKKSVKTSSVCVNTNAPTDWGYESSEEQKQQQMDHSVLFHVQLPQFNVITGKGLQPADPHMNTDAEVRH